MIVRCDQCQSMYDDAEQWAICPHGPLWGAPGAYCKYHDLVDCPICNWGERPKMDDLVDREDRCKDCGGMTPRGWDYCLHHAAVHRLEDARQSEPPTEQSVYPPPLLTPEEADKLLGQHERIMKDMGLRDPMAPPVMDPRMFPEAMIDRLSEANRRQAAEIEELKARVKALEEKMERR